MLFRSRIRINGQLVGTVRGSFTLGGPAPFPMPPGFKPKAPDSVEDPDAASTTFANAPTTTGTGDGAATPTDAALTGSDAGTNPTDPFNPVGVDPSTGDGDPPETAAAAPATATVADQGPVVDAIPDVTSPGQGTV